MFSRSPLMKVPSTKNFSRPFLTQRFWYPFNLFLLFNTFLHAQKVVVFTVVYWKACDILWKWYTNVNICFFFTFNLTFYTNQQNEPCKCWNVITLGDCLILVWKSSNSYYICNSTSHVWKQKVSEKVSQ